MFPNAEIVVDRFHIIAMMTRAFNQTRVQTMKKYDKKSIEYRLLKFSWKLYLKHFDELEVSQTFYDRHLRQQLTQQGRVQMELDTDDTISSTYDALQGIMSCLKNHDKMALFTISTKMKT
ncbi:transposase [Lactiplantibacillus plantarum]|nr:transposase [Lactiplantibacillus plantarum]